VGFTLDGSAAGHYTKKKQTETECATQTLVGWYNHCEGRVLGEGNTVSDRVDDNDNRSLRKRRRV